MERKVPLPLFIVMCFEHNQYTAEILELFLLPQDRSEEKDTI